MVLAQNIVENLWSIFSGKHLVAHRDILVSGPRNSRFLLRAMERSPFTGAVRLAVPDDIRGSELIRFFRTPDLLSSNAAMSPRAAKD
jgi:hypothetical protein